MAYFDSTKNRALWEIRLGELKKERAAREAGGGGSVREEAPKEMTGKVRIPISYQELLKREAMENGRERAAKDQVRERARQRQRERQQERQAQA